MHTGLCWVSFCVGQWVMVTVYDPLPALGPID